ncbi:MAG: Kelch repeat type 1-containing protein [Cyanobacteria bacterium RYN_339]|nr:Kelch repeat type 1-containing protein [Cyanobacteria bacterium RYN_339]
MTRRPVYLSLTLAALLLGCPNNTNQTATSGHPIPARSTLGAKASPSTAATATPSADGAGSTTTPLHVPTIKPPIKDPENADPSLAPGQVAFSIGKEPNGVWGLGPYMVRARAAMLAGSVGSAIIVAEGDHRPSLEVWDPDREASWHLDTRHDPDAGADFPSHVHGGGFMWATGGTYKNELWSAGGFDGQLAANATTGSGQIYLYREDQGFSKKRKESEGVRTLTAGGATRAAAGGVIDHIFYICGGTFGDTQAAGLFDGQNQQISSTSQLKPITLTATVRNDVQRVDITTFDDATKGATMPTGVASSASVVYKGHLYVIGGYTFDAKGGPVATDKVQDYDAKANTWVQSGDSAATIPALPVALHSAAAACTAHTMYVAGGLGADGKPRNSFYYYDFNSPPTARAWKEAPSMPTARGMLALVPFQDALWAIGGVGVEGQALRTVEKYYTEIPSP